MRGVRVIAGSARGRRLAVPRGDAVRPTKDVVREAMFSAIEARGRLADTVVLDLYAGSGALAIEALSRGASRAVLVERDPAALAAIATNVEVLGFADRTRVVRADVRAFLAGAPAREAPFGLVLVDPPYDLASEAVAAVLDALGRPGWLAPDALVSVERPVHAPVAPPALLRSEWERRFGDTLVQFLVV